MGKGIIYLCSHTMEGVDLFYNANYQSSRVLADKIDPHRNTYLARLRNLNDSNFSF